MKRVLLLSAALLAAAGLIAVLDRFQGDIAAAWQQRRYPRRAAASVGPQGRAILAEIRDQRAREVSKEYGRIRARMDEARAKGAPVAALEPTLELALKLARAGKFREAMRLLNAVELRVPRGGEGVVPAKKKAVRRRVRR